MGFDSTALFCGRCRNLEFTVYGGFNCGQPPVLSIQAAPWFSSLVLVLAFSRELFLGNGNLFSCLNSNCINLK